MLLIHTCLPLLQPSKRTHRECQGMESGCSRWSLRGKTALVTGGTRGIGKAIVEDLAKLGASVYTCARSENDLKERVQAWKDAGLAVAGSVCDVSSAEARKQLMQAVSEHFNGKLNILVNNAGTFIPAQTENPAAENFSILMHTNFESCFYLSQLAHPFLKASGEGNIVFNSSIAGSVPFTSQGTVYSTLKGALNQLTRTLACEWAKDGIRVNAVAPGYTLTDLFSQAIPPDVVQKIEERTPLRRIGQPEEISAAVAFLCMPCSSFTTGVILTIDGGVSTHCYAVPCPPIERV